MSLKFNQFLLFCLIATSIVLNSCGARLDQSITLQPSPGLATSTQVPATSTLTVTPTFSPTDWIGALLTTTPPIYPLPTLPPDCGTVKLGGAGTQTIDNSEKILVQGTAIICGQVYTDTNGVFWHPVAVVEAMLDLDTGTFDLKSADLQFCPGGGSMIFYYFCDVNSALIKEFGFTMQKLEQPTFEDCKSVSKPHESTNDNEPIYVCVITNKGHVARVKVERPNPLGKYVMSQEISFVTWEK